MFMYEIFKSAVQVHYTLRSVSNIPLKIIFCHGFTRTRENSRGHGVVRVVIFFFSLLLLLFIYLFFFFNIKQCVCIIRVAGDNNGRPALSKKHKNGSTSVHPALGVTAAVWIIIIQRIFPL